MTRNQALKLAGIILFPLFVVLGVIIMIGGVYDNS